MWSVLVLHDDNTFAVWGILRIGSCGDVRLNWGNGCGLFFEGLC